MSPLRGLVDAVCTPRVKSPLRGLALPHNNSDLDLVNNPLLLGIKLYFFKKEKKAPSKSPNAFTIQNKKLFLHT